MLFSVFSFFSCLHASQILYHNSKHAKEKILQFVCSRDPTYWEMYLENVCSSLSVPATKLQIKAPHLISQASCVARRCGRLHIAHFILTTGSWDEALREIDEKPGGDCIQCVFPG